MSTKIPCIFPVNKGELGQRDLRAGNDIVELTDIAEQLNTLDHG